MMRGTNWEGADLSGSSLFGSFAKGANFRNTNLTGADLESMDFDGADLTGAQLAGAQVLKQSYAGCLLKPMTCIWRPDGHALVIRPAAAHEAPLVTSCCDSGVRLDVHTGYRTLSWHEYACLSLICNSVEVEPAFQRYLLRLPQSWLLL